MITALDLPDITYFLWLTYAFITPKLLLHYDSNYKNFLGNLFQIHLSTGIRHLELLSLDSFKVKQVSPTNIKYKIFDWERRGCHVSISKSMILGQQWSIRHQ